MSSNHNKVDYLVDEMREYNGKSLKIMEICGTHTASIYKNGIDSILSNKISLISGPGCPVCVTSENYIDLAIKLSEDSKNIIVSFGDLLRVLGTHTNLLNQKRNGKNIEMIYSPLEAITIALNNKDKEVIFLAVGFEPTAAIYTILLDNIIKYNLMNISILTALKTIPNTLKTFIKDESIKIDAFIAPGHVASIIGKRDFDIIANEYKKPIIITGFKGHEIIKSLYKLVKMVNDEDNQCYNFYKEAVCDNGNEVAKSKIDKYFSLDNAYFRGIGTIEKAGLSLRPEYAFLDTMKKFDLKIDNPIIDNSCICGEVLKGKKKPCDCKLFNIKCKPNNPKGPCMVSLEGCCNNYYKYKIID